jgi:ABC-2 type transport system permease protein
VSHEPHPSSIDTSAGDAAVAPRARMLLAQTRAELTMRWRVPAFSLTSLALPVVFFTFFGLPVAGLTRSDGISVGAFLVASFGAYAVGSVMVYSFGIGVAVERGMKVDLLMRVLPVPPGVYLLAKVITALIFSLVSLVVLIAYGALVGGVTQPALVWVEMSVRLLAGSLPFIGLGFAIGYLAGPHSAPAVANLVYLPLAFASGLFVPPSQLPGFVQAFAPYLPTYHYGQLVWGSLRASTEPLAVSVAWLAGYTVLFFALALRAYRGDEQRKFA